jgi:molecular chaperone GrpE
MLSSSISRRIAQDVFVKQGVNAMSRTAASNRFASLRQSNAVQQDLLNKTFSVNTVRPFSDNTSSGEGEKKKEEVASTEDSSPQEEGEEESQENEPTDVEKLEVQVKELKDQLLRSYAEQENIRTIAKRDVENSRSFAISSFAKSMLDTSDNLTRALDAVPEEYRDDKENHSVLATLFEGIKMTDDGLTKAFAKNGLQKFGEVGEKFDPNLHDALFEYPDENMEAGSIGQVMKVGFSLKNRVIRPAEVGVIKS